MSTNRDKPFEPGEKIEWDGTTATVLTNSGTSGNVILDQDGLTVRWYWTLGAIECVRIEG